MISRRIFRASLILAMFCASVWFAVTFTVVAAIGALITVAVFLVGFRYERRPNPYGTTAQGPELCPHCFHRINADNAVRTSHIEQPVEGRSYFVRVPAVMHERCARERQAVES